MSGARDTYGVGKLADERTIEAPDLPYLPRDPQQYRPGIGVVGCGGISEMHLIAYRRAGYDVRALCDVVEERAVARQREVYRDAAVFTDWRKMLEFDGLEVVDVATHPNERVAIMEGALRAGKHVLSQKPFVNDLEIGKHLVALADQYGRKLAVNQNGRYAPHFSWIRQAVARGLLGSLDSIDISIHWDHGWVVGTPLDDTQHLLLHDFGVHWFDLMCVLFADIKPLRVNASVGRTATQRSKQPLIAHAAVAFERGRGSLSFHGDSRHFQRDTTIVAGSEGVLVADGCDLQHQSISLHTAAGVARPRLEGSWFENGFHGSMAELLCAIEEEREPENAARTTLGSLALTFAACESSITYSPCTID